MTIPRDIPSSPAALSATQAVVNLPAAFRPFLRTALISLDLETFSKPLREAGMTDHAVRRDRPLSRRRFRIFRPDLVRILLRNPCSLFLFLTLGWYVRFNCFSPFEGPVAQVCSLYKTLFACQESVSAVNPHHKAKKRPSAPCGGHRAPAAVHY